jgi:hypothetical protein
MGRRHAPGPRHDRPRRPRGRHVGGLPQSAFGALFAGDPAWDLGAAWLLLPDGNASRFFERYAQADEATVRRARGLAVMKSLFLMLMGQNGDRGLPGGKPTWGPAGRSALDRVLKGL